MSLERLERQKPWPGSTNKKNGLDDDDEPEATHGGLDSWGISSWQSKGNFLMPRGTPPQEIAGVPY